MRIQLFTIFLLFAAFDSHLCQNDTTPRTTTTLEPNSTTTEVPKSTTTQAPKSTTEPPKPTTTEAPKTTTVAPTPAPKIIEGNVTENNYTCIRFEFTVQFDITYNVSNNETKQRSVLLPLDSKLTFPSGTCSSPKESITLTSPNSTLIFNLTFGSNENSAFLDSINLTVVYDKWMFPNIEPALIGTNHTYNLTDLNPNFNVEKDHSYVCANVTVPKNGDGEVKITFSNLKLQAFMGKGQKGQFSAEHNCQNEINDVVPIAVGAALTGLVVIVMIAYFIGRRRSRRLAYQSV